MKFNNQVEQEIHRIDKILVAADKFAHEHKELVYCAEENTFYKWKDNYYQPLLDIQLERYLIDFEEFAYMSLPALNAFKRRLATISHRSIDDFNANEIMDFPNGVLNMKTGQFGDHKKEYLSTIRIPYEYDKDAKCPLWMKFLEQCLEDDKEKIGVLQEYMGYCLGRDNSFHKSLILLGDGRNGKGTTFFIISHLVGEKNCSALKIGDMNKPETVANLVNKLVNIDGDTDATATGFEADFRRITAGDSMTAKLLYKNHFTFTPYVKLVVGANDLPRISDKTHGFYDRLIIIPYNVSFFGKEDPDLKPKLLTEISGILNWALEGRIRLYDKKKFTITKTLSDYVLEIKKENNPIEIFVDEYLGFTDGVKTVKKEVYDYYYKWCKEVGHRSLSMIKFNKELFRICKDKTQKDKRDATNSNKPIWPNLYVKTEITPINVTEDGEFLGWE